MDFPIADDHTLYIPPEVLDNILSRLQDDLKSIACARLVCKAFCFSATPLLTDLWNTPSQLFVSPLGRGVYKEDAWPVPEPLDGSFECRKVVTTWTWLDVPEHVKLEDRATSEGGCFRELISRHQRGRGLIGACWGRVAETPWRFWIMLHWTNAKFWEAYRSSTSAKELKDFLESLSENCVAPSREETMFFVGGVICRKYLFKGFSEVRTIYFEPSMSRDQQRTFEEKLKPRVNVIHMQRPEENDIGRFQWTWLPGFRTFQGQRTIACRFVFQWNSPESEAYHKTRLAKLVASGKRHNLFHLHRLCDLSPIQLEAAGFLGDESFHCDFRNDRDIY